MFITSGPRADFVTCAVRTGEAGHGGLSLLVIERGTPGFEVSRKLKKMGWWASDTAELAFDACRVPAANFIGEENAGFGYIVTNFVAERLFLAGQCVAIAELAYRESKSYAAERKAFGKPLAGFQVTRHDSPTWPHGSPQLERSPTRSPCGTSAGRAPWGWPRWPRTRPPNACSWVCDQAVQLHGGYGYMRETVVERLYRDARLYPIGGGTREIMNEIISKLEGY